MYRATPRSVRVALDGLADMRRWRGMCLARCVRVHQGIFRRLVLCLHWPFSTFARLASSPGPMPMLTTANVFIMCEEPMCSVSAPLDDGNHHNMLSVVVGGSSSRSWSEHMFLYFVDVFSPKIHSQPPFSHPTLRVDEQVH